MSENLEYIINPDVEEYAEAHTTPETEALYNLNRWTHINMPYPRMLSGHYQGKLLEFISCMKKPRLILEIGTYVGYSTVCLSKGLAQNGIIHTIEADEEYEDIIRNTLQTAGITDKTVLHIGPAIEILPQLKNDKFDLAFIDADKTNTALYYETIVPMMNPEGIILIDNILWSGKVTLQQNKADKDTTTFKQLNDIVQNDPRVENILLPIRDGLMMCRKL